MRRGSSWQRFITTRFPKIIPNHFTPSDSGDVKALTDPGVLHRLDPTVTAEDVAQEFVEYAYSYLFDKKQRESLFLALSMSESRFRIQPGKMAPRVRPALIDLQMMSLPERGDDFDLDPVTGGVYMAFLARKISPKHGLPVVTHDPVFQK